MCNPGGTLWHRSRLIGMPFKNTFSVQASWLLDWFYPGRGTDVTTIYARRQEKLSLRYTGTRVRTSDLLDIGLSGEPLGSNRAGNSDQNREGRAEPPNCELFPLAIVCVPSLPPQEKGRNCLPEKPRSL